MAAALIPALTFSFFLSPSAQASTPVICLAYDTGGPGDSSFNDAAQAGLKVAVRLCNLPLKQR